jgi:predicted Zn finger-like uncharacterized protein
VPISIQCENCFKTYRVTDKLIGKTVRCKSCGTAIRIAREAKDSDKREPSAKARSSGSVMENADELFDDAPRSNATKRRSLKRVRRVSIFGEFLKIFRKATPQSERSHAGFGFNAATAIVMISVVAIAVQVILGVTSLSNPDRFRHYYGSVIYLGLPATFVTWVLAAHLQEPDEPIFVTTGKLVLLLALAIAGFFVARLLRLPRQVVRLVALVAFAAQFANAQRKSQEVWRKHPLAMTATAFVTLAPIGGFAHFLSVSLNGQDIQARQALQELLPFIQGL